MEMSAWELHTEATRYQFEAEEITLGPWTSYSLIHDPKHLVFVLSRYKFVSKMIAGKRNVLEIGCGDGFGSPIIASVPGLEKLYCLDWDQRNISGNIRRLGKILPKVEFIKHDINESPFNVSNKVPFDAAFMIDVIEHVEPISEAIFMENICKSLSENSILITGTPNIHASPWASPQSAAQHINLKSPESLNQLMKKYFLNVFSFGMNDETLHSGYSKMCHYIWTVAASPKNF
jgi:2-polyprenyl-3-methyl-5-hydroxy-6-metoxy-1,4-benzoquinol methylase